MTWSMTRWTLAGRMALAALGAVAVFDVGYSTAEAAPRVRRFAGKYDGADPRGAWSSWTITISNEGRINCPKSGGPLGHGTIRGRVRKNGNYSFKVRAWDREFRAHYESAGTMALDAAGNIVGTGDSGGSFTWLRR